MAATDISVWRVMKRIDFVVMRLDQIKTNDIPKYQALFGTSGTATGNNVIGLRNTIVGVRALVNDLVTNYDRAALDNAWPLVTGVTPVNSRSNMQDMRAALFAILTHIRTSSDRVSKIIISSDYGPLDNPVLTDQERAGILPLINAVGALITV